MPRTTLRRSYAGTATRSPEVKRVVTIGQRLAIAGAALILSAGCGGSGNGESDAPTNPTLKGEVVRLSGAPCAWIRPSGEEIEVADRQLTVRNGEGEVIATTTTTDGEHTWRGQRANEGCRLSATYEVEIPREDFYTVEIEPIEEPSLPISYKELEDRGFTYDLEVSG